MTQHTPGPWEFIELGTANAAVRISGDCAVSGSYQGGDSDILSHEDARLIAAAPDLLAALCDVVGCFGDDEAWWDERAEKVAERRDEESIAHHTDRVRQAVLDAARAALAKAREG